MRLKILVRNQHLDCPECGVWRGRIDAPEILLRVKLSKRYWSCDYCGHVSGDKPLFNDDYEAAFPDECDPVPMGTYDALS